MSIIKVIIGFILLQISFHVIPSQFNLYGALGLMVPILIFLTLWGLSKWNGKRIGDYALRDENGLRRWATGAIIGFIFYGLLVGSYHFLGRYEWGSWKSFSDISMFLPLSIISMIIGSLCSDLVTKAYLYGELKEKLSPQVLFILLLLVYSLDDVWNEGLTLSNTLFSFALGSSMIYALLRTGSIWMTTGIHAGWNILYAWVYGLPGTGQNGGLIELTSGEYQSYYLLVSITVCTLLLAFVWWLLKRNENSSSHSV